MQVHATIVARSFIVFVSKTMSDNNHKEPQLFSEEQTTILKSMMASAVAEALATVRKPVDEEQWKKGEASA